MTYTNFLALVLLAFGAVVYANEHDHEHEHRQHGVHEHGGGELNVAVENDSLLIELSLPAMNVVGFEHPATNQHQQEQVRNAADLLKRGLKLFSPTAAARCTLIRAEVVSALLETHEDPHEQAHHHDDQDHDEPEHADFDVVYEFNCARPGQLQALEVSLFELFPGTDHLEVQVITPNHQGGSELSADHHRLSLR